MKRYFGFGLIFIVLFTGACGYAQGPKEKLSRRIFEFNEGLRWGRYNDVLPFVEPAVIEHFSKMHEGWGESLKVSNAEVVQSVYDEKARKAVVQVKFTWYRSNEMVVYDTVTSQNWEYRNGRWWMVAEEYQSGEAF